MYDLIVIGAGAAGMNTAVPVARLGLKTLLVERDESKLGGECLWTGCVPSKAILHVAKLAHDASKLSPFGVTTNGTINFTAVMNYVRNVQQTIGAHENAEALRKQGLELAFGEARFAGKDAIEVAGETYRSRRFVIATGSRPRRPSIPGIENVEFLNNENLWTLEALPKRLLVLGAGPIGIEMSQAFARLGSQVTLIEKGQRILPRDHEEAAAVLRATLENEGVTFHLNSEVESFPTAHTARIKNSGGSPEVPFDRALIAIGKDLDFAGFGLDAAGIEIDRGRLKLDPYLRTTNKRVYAAGDAAGQIFLTHVTELHGSVIVWNLLSPFKRAINYDNLGWVTFTDPEIATFGLSERELTKRGIHYRKVVQGFQDVNRADTDDFPDSKLIVYLKGDQILGGTMVAPGAGELIQELILAKQNKIPLRKLLEKVYPYPTATRINRWMVLREYDRKLTGNLKRLARFGYRWLG